MNESEEKFSEKEVALARKIIYILLEACPPFDKISAGKLLTILESVVCVIIGSISPDEAEKNLDIFFASAKKSLQKILQSIEEFEEKLKEQNND